jgi:hypothetical protein
MPPGRIERLAMQREKPLLLNIFVMAAFILGWFLLPQ